MSDYNYNLTPTEQKYYDAVNKYHWLNRKELGKLLGRSPTTIGKYYWRAKWKMYQAHLKSLVK